MEEDDISFLDVPADAASTSYERQLSSLKTYLDSLPYECETVEQFQEILEDIVGKICIAAEAKHWNMLTQWDGLLQCWLTLLYPMPTTTRAKLIRVYYELCILPGVDARCVRSWADTLSRLIGSKYRGLRKLEPSDLELPWEPLWEMVKKELWPKLPATDVSRNIVTLLFYVIDKCRPYYPPSSVPEMLDTFLPMLTQESLLTMIPVLTSFLPLTQSRLYIPPLFKIWEAFNSSIVDDRMLELCGDLSEEHVAGTAGEDGEYAAEWKDVGIWTQWQWDLLSGKCMGSTNMPVGLLGGQLNTTSGIADSNSKHDAVAKIFVYSMRVDGEVRDTSAEASKQTGYLAGSKALSSLEKLINSSESYFHPSNTGPWTLSLTSLIQRLCAEFITRYNEQDTPNCKVPESQRLTPQIRRAFVTLLRTPALLSMFAKDAVSASYAQGALRTLAMLEPKLVMPELLDRAYGGLEVVNETHRTTGVLSTLSGVARPLVTSNIWLGGQKHLVPLLDLCLPGIDLNDPTKTIYACMFIVNTVQHIKVGDLSAHQGGVPFTSDFGEDRMDVDEHVDHLPDDLGGPVLSREEEQSLTRDSTSGFADWVVSLFRRVFTLYENLPEEGGKRNVTGGRTEESVLKHIKGMLDMVCLHLSEPIFDLVLKLVYEYATTNAKSNAVRAFGQLISSMAKANPAKVVARFLPHCAEQIEEELRHGASSVRTTSTHAAVPSDTTLHWNLAILRGCLGYGASALLDYKPLILRLLSVAVEKTKSERGYTSTGRLITRILTTLSSVYPLNGRFVNTSEWEQPGKCLWLHFDRSHNQHWGKLYEPKDVQIDWHVPSAEEIDFVLEIMDTIEKPMLDKVESLLENTSKWDHVSRNDFCRFLQAARAVWIGLPTIYRIQEPEVVRPLLLPEYEVPDMLVKALNVNCGFVLTDPSDPRYQKVAAYRERFGRLLVKASSILRQNSGGEDHIDAVIYVTRCIDTYLGSYGVSNSEYDAMQKNYKQARELNRSWLRQKDNSRLIFVKRAHVYHMSRLHIQSMFRYRSELDDQLLLELAELSLLQYTRIRRQAQATLITATMRYVRSTRLILPTIFKGLTRGSDADAIKGALYVLSSRGIAGYTLSDLEYNKTYLLSILECQHEEKPSIQKLVSSVASDTLSLVNEDHTHTAAYRLKTPRLDAAIADLRPEFSDSFPDQRLATVVLEKNKARVERRLQLSEEIILDVLEVAKRSTTHWRYSQIALQFLSNLIWREVLVSPELAKFVAEQTVSPQQTIRSHAQRTAALLLYHVKIRTYSKTREDRWAEKWASPWKTQVPVNDPATFLDEYHRGIQQSTGNIYIDKFATGFLSWAPKVNAYHSPDSVSAVQWEEASLPMMHAFHSVVGGPDYVKRIATLWGQESDKNVASLDLRMENVVYLKLLSKFYGDALLPKVLEEADSLVVDADKFKQRAGAEFVLSVLRGSKHWPTKSSAPLWKWLEGKLDAIFAQIKPDTLSLWEQVIHSQLTFRDPRRNKVLVDWIRRIPLEFSGSSAFDMTKSLTMFGALLATTAFMERSQGKKYIDLFFNNISTDYAELRQHLCNHLYLLMRNLWQPWHASTEAFVSACTESNDALQVRRAIYMDHISEIISNLPKWREERLPPPRVNQSQYDKVGLTVLQWIWISAYGAPAHLVIPYVVPLLPEILRMSELSDNTDLQAYSSGVLYVLSALTPLSDYVNPILDQFVTSIESSPSWRTRLHGLPAVAIFFFRNLLTLSQSQMDRVLRVLLDCLSNENVEVRDMAAKVLSSVVRTSQRQSIIPLKNRFTALARKTTLPARKHPEYATRLRTLHSAILGLCALLESFPYSVEPWMPPLTEVLAPHATDPPPISTTIRKCASEFKKTHQDTWHKDQHLFDEDQLQSLSTMVVGTSYYA
ncbi:hypothetical protein CC1G_13601 [Coprinopsis cinerea okayama7|uniref:Proteasome activator subunit 4 n=1 Tax=Coprinopsis cinerea (strain Okayama-7 / 130 / ATCC MYA-4618 / FGSC 9003) TaxID=240176 RepID=D6RJU8_COPC7|nr:hypothetical protein CC1G_13601 [Coprinopsis cinerea okayama7\|eukprot:XP_002912068.1 hypothetical protein CC1G_13601 [Coprinopsis cinerea okayama7\